VVIITREGVLNLIRQFWKAFFWGGIRGTGEYKVHAASNILGVLHLYFVKKRGIPSYFRIEGSGAQSRIQTLFLD